jgi:hypothetical protein
MNSHKFLYNRKQRQVEWMLPVHVVARELKKYRDRTEKEIQTCAHTWPSYGRAANKKKAWKDLSFLIIKYKRREKWELLKADLGSEYLERIHEASLQNIAQVGQSFNLNGHTVQLQS